MTSEEQPISMTGKKDNFFRLKVISISASFLVALFVVLFFIRRIFILKRDTFDQRIFNYFHGYVSDAATSFIECFTLLGSQFFLIPAYLLLMAYFFFIKKNNWLGITVVGVSISSLLVMFTLKLLFKRPRPIMPLLEKVPGLSFPSGHAFMSLSFFGLLIYLINMSSLQLWKKIIISIILAAIILLIGISRIYLRVHYATDVITGFCMGYMWMVISLGLLNLSKKSLGFRD